MCQEVLQSKSIWDFKKQHKCCRTLLWIESANINAEEANPKANYQHLFPKHWLKQIFFSCHSFGIYFWQAHWKQKIIWKLWLLSFLFDIKEPNLTSEARKHQFHNHKDNFPWIQDANSGAIVVMICHFYQLYNWTQLPSSLQVWKRTKIRLRPVSLHESTDNISLIWSISLLHSFNFYYENLRAYIQGFPGGSGDKESACNAGDPGLIPGFRRSPGEGNGDLLQYSCLGNPMDRGAWQAKVQGVTQNQTRFSD